MRYHISIDGKTRVCRSKGPCPLGTNFELKSDAVRYSEDKEEFFSAYSSKFNSEFVKQYTEKEAAKRGEFVNETTSKWLKNKKDTISLYYNKETGEFSQERKILHREILDELHAKYESIPANGLVVFSAGLPGAGKTTVLNMLDKTEGIQIDQYATVSSDDFKEILAERNMIPRIEGLDKMEASTLVHEESSYLADKFLEELSDKKKNLIYDFTCKNHISASKRIELLKNSGYEEKNMQFVFVDIPLETAKKRAIGRYMYGLNKSQENRDDIGGRFLPPIVLEQSKSKTGKYSSVNAESVIQIFNLYKENGLPIPIVYDNSGDSRKDPSYKPSKLDFIQFSDR